MKKLLKSITITVLIAITSLCLFACDVGVKNKQPTEADYEYTEIKDGDNVISYAIGLSQSHKVEKYDLISLPTEYLGKPVTQIMAEGFLGVEVESVYIPEGYTAINRDAFGNCRALKEIEIPKTVESIGDRAFAFCDKLKTVEFKSGLKSIGSLAFLGCDTFTDVILPDTLTEISKDSFQDCERVILHVDANNSYFTVEDNKIINK